MKSTGTISVNYNTLILTISEATPVTTVSSHLSVASKSC